MRTVASALLMGVVMACSGNGTSQVTTNHPPLTYQQLAARPLRLPSLPPDRTCPTNSISLQGGTAPRIGTHVRLGFGGAGPHGGSPWNKTVWDMPSVSSLPNVLLRGGRLDGPGSLYFDGDGNGSPEANRRTVVDALGAQTAFYSELRLPRDSNAAFYTYPTTSGCYAIRADSDRFSEIIVFKVT